MGKRAKPEAVAPAPDTEAPPDDRFAPDKRLLILRGGRRHDDHADRAFRLLAGVLEAAEAIAFQLAHRHPPACPCRPCEFLRDEARCPGLLPGVRGLSDLYGGWLRQACDGTGFPRDTPISADLTQLAELASLVEEEADDAAEQAGDGAVRMVKSQTGRAYPRSAGLTDGEAAGLLALLGRLKDRDPAAGYVSVHLAYSRLNGGRGEANLTVLRDVDTGARTRRDQVRYTEAGPAEGGSDVTA